ncbi:MAG: hypothetical protein WC889_13450 [Myxococcota bacterium]
MTLYLPDFTLTERLESNMRNTSTLQQEGWKALVNALGYADALRYRLIFEQGMGNYMEEREEMFAGETVDSLIAKVKEFEVSHSK